MGLFGKTSGLKVKIVDLQRSITRKKNAYIRLKEKVDYPERHKPVSSSQIARYKADMDRLDYEIGTSDDQLSKLEVEQKKEVEAEELAKKREEAKRKAEQREAVAREEFQRREALAAKRTEQDIIEANIKAERAGEIAKRMIPPPRKGILKRFLERRAERPKLPRRKPPKKGFFEERFERRAKGLKPLGRAEPRKGFLGFFRGERLAPGEKRYVKKRIETVGRGVKQGFGWFPRKIAGEISAWKTMRIERGRRKYKDPEKARIAAQKEYKKRERGYIPTFRKGGKWAVGKLWQDIKNTSGDVLGLPGRILRRGMNKEDYQKYKQGKSGIKSEYKLEKARRAAEYRMQTGKWLTPSQQGWLKLFYKGVFAIVIIILFYSIFANTSTGKALLARTGFGLGPIFEKLKTAPVIYAKELQAKITGVGDWRNPYATETKEKKGIDITSVSSLKDTYLPDDEIEIIGEGIIKALERPASVEFGCYMDKVGHMVKILSVVPNVDTPFGVRCNLGKRDFKVENVLYKTAKFVAVYNNYETNARLRLYVLPKDEKEKLGSIDIFRKYQIRDTLLDLRTKTTRSTYEFGPLKVSMFVVDRQPLSEDEKYLFKIGVDVDKLSWEGKLKGGTLELKFPENVELLTKDCRAAFDIKDGMTKYCDFEVKNIEEGLSFVEIEARAIYNFEFSKDVSIIIHKTEETKAIEEAKT